MNPAMLDMGSSDINGNNGNNEKVSIAPETGADVLDLGDYRLTRANRLVELLAAIPGELPAPFTWEGMACYAFDPGLSDNDDASDSDDTSDNDDTTVHRHTLRMNGDGSGNANPATPRPGGLDSGRFY